MKVRNKKSLAAEERRRGVAAILALAVRRILRDEQNSKVLSTDVSNRVELVLEKRLSVSRVSDGSGLSNE
ncbi:MAG: hypothetical protein JNM43_01685 [Planctomycetaceae bacterium]|nr:hypothetical protein [Planctomycetaceae bacterium]